MAKEQTTVRGKRSRRDFLRVAGGGAAAAATFGVVTLSPKQAQAQSFDAEYDMVVCGGGGAGLPSALFSRWLGNKVLVLEKAATLGGTSFKAAYWYWVPNNAAMQKAGIPDSKEHYMRYVARLTQPQSFDPQHPRLGLSEWEYAMCEAIYDSASGGYGVARREGRTAVPSRGAGAGLLRRDGNDRCYGACLVSEGRRGIDGGWGTGCNAHSVGKPAAATAWTSGPANA